METLSHIWHVIAPYITSGAVATIIGAIIGGIIKGSTAKAVSKFDVQKTANDIVEQSIKQIKNTTMSQNIQPLVSNELKKVSEEASASAVKELQVVNTNYNNIILILEKLAHYFDNSVAITEKSKEELINAINNAKIVPTTIECKVVEEQVKETPKTSQNVNLER